MSRFIYCFGLVILIFFVPERFSAFNAELNLWFSIIYFILLIVFFIEQKRLTRNWLRFDFIFILGFTIVHIQIPFMASLGIEPSGAIQVFENKQVVNFATWMSVFSLGLWMLGYSIIISHRERRRVNSKSKSYPSHINYGKLDVILIIVFFLFIILVGPALVSGVYAGSRNWGEGSEYAFLILRILLILRIVYFFKDVPRGSSLKYILHNALSNKVFLIVFIAYSGLFLFQGDRGPIVMIALVTGGCYAIFVKPFSLNRLLFFGVIAAITFTLIGLGRTRDINDTIDGNIFQRGYMEYQANDSGLNPTDELASSVRMQYRALNLIPSRHPYLYGITYAIGIAGIIPFGASTIINFFNVPPMYKSTTSFLTIMVKGVGFNSGDGSEILADIYVNFGVYGVFIIMFLFGLFAGTVFFGVRDLNFNYILIFIVLLFSALTMNRGVFLTPLKDIFYILFFNYLIKNFLSRRELKKF